MEKLNKALIKVQSELKAPKNQRNNFGKYNYRSAEDILEAVKPLLAKNGLSLTISDDVVGIGSLAFINATATISDGVDEITASAQAGIDPNRKGMDIAQSFGSSSSYARKYALNGMFLIDDTKDADATNTHGQSSSQSSTPKASPSSDAFQKSVDYIKASKTKKVALEQVLSKYGDTFSDKQKEALGKFVK
tara:strand:- start:438 stop:1010 length:573 start_codon:yes stop_codon:yes gene_type:complete